MKAKDRIKLIAKYSRCELDELTLLEIAEEGKNFNIPKFLNFIKNNLDRVELQYIPNGIERFLKFCKLYQAEVDAPRVKKAKSEAETLFDKFNYIKNTLFNELNTGKNPKLENIRTDGRDYFTSFQIKHLRAIGNIRRLIFLANNGFLLDEIEKSFIGLIKNSKEKESQKTLDFLKVKRF